MKLSVVIVNYNVKFFLEQCLHSVQKAAGKIQAEIIVIDNHSVDGSCRMVREKFPGVILIENKSNTGFSHACNQGIRHSSGEYVLLLNPDTVVGEYTLEKCIGYLDQHPDAGALGVRMVDGKGRFLPESKRALPTPTVAFFKLSGLTRLFPRSNTLGKYYLGHLNEFETTDIEVLTGAFMMIRKTVLDKVGLLDEDYFMYGEDIDLSYRILQAGYRVVYFPETSIIHYKGESTKKTSIQYVILFYRAMLIFAEKHLTSTHARLFSFLIKGAIYCRAGLSILRRFFKRILFPAVDALLILAGFMILTPLWEKIRFPEGGNYPDGFYLYLAPGMIIIWLISLLLAGGYDPPVRLSRITSGWLAGTVIILIIYALLPEHFRYSRMLILAGSGWTLGTLLIFRLGMHWLPWTQFRLAGDRKKRILIAGSEKEARRVYELLNLSGTSCELAGVATPPGGFSDASGLIADLEEMIRVHQAGEVIFCARDIPAGLIIQCMNRLNRFPVEYKIAPPESASVIGSHSIHTPGELFLLHFNTITQPSSRRNKRLLDLTLSVLFLVCFPITFFLFRKPLRLLRNIVLVLSGKCSWVGFYPLHDAKDQSLPDIRPGILYTLPPDTEQKDVIDKGNLVYARDYSPATDIKIIWKARKHLDR